MFCPIPQVADNIIKTEAGLDGLTGLLTRETFFAKAAELIAAHEPGYYVIECFDINSFIVINEQYGSAKGDQLLKHVADTLRCSFEPLGGICCRMQGDDFALLYPCCFMETEMMTEIRRAGAVLEGLQQPVTFSIGRYVVTDVALAVSAMYDRAVLAEASVKGRFDVSIGIYEQWMLDKLLHEQKIVSEMLGALQNGQFEIWFQPQFAHDAGALIGAEALVRWRHPLRGLVTPSEFIPVFERNGFIYELDKYVWEQVCRTIRKWIDTEGMLLPVSVNISRYDLFCEDFIEVLTGLVARYQIPVELLRLEITESAFAESTEQLLQVIDQLLDYGFAVEIDDFGSGYSSLNTLKDVHADILKLDMRFLEDSKNAKRGSRILEAMVSMAKCLGMSVIAEGVETSYQADYLNSIGCNYVQGYLYARPLPLADYEKLAAARTNPEINKW